MATIKPRPTPDATEDSAVAFATKQAANNRTLWQKFVKRTYTLTDGSRAGDVVDYFVPEVGLAGADSSGAVPGSGFLATTSSEFARPADTTAYTALDAVSNSTSAPTVLSFANAARSSGGSGYIVKARLFTDQKTNTAQFRLHLFTTSPTAINDNAPQTLLYANRAARIGHITFDAAATEDPTNSTGANSLKSDLRIPFISSGGSTIYGMLETLTAFTPASAQNFYVELSVDQN